MISINIICRLSPSFRMVKMTAPERKYQRSSGFLQNKGRCLCFLMRNTCRGCLTVL